MFTRTHICMYADTHMQGNHPHQMHADTPTHAHTCMHKKACTRPHAHRHTHVYRNINRLTDPHTGTDTHDRSLCTHLDIVKRGR